MLSTKKSIKTTFLIQYDYNGYLKHSKLDLENCVLGPQIWMFDNHIEDILEHPEYYKKIIAPSQWVKDKFHEKFNVPEHKVSIYQLNKLVSSCLKLKNNMDVCIL